MASLRELAEGVNRPAWLHLSFGEWMSVLEAMASQEAVATRLPQLRELEGRFSDTHLRTLQRGVKKWRGVLAKKLVYASPDQSVPTLLSMPEDVPVGADHRV